MDRLGELLRQAAAVADAVRYAGDRRAAWTRRPLVPPGARSQTGERDSAQTECVLSPAVGATLGVRLRFHQLEWRGAGPAATDRSAPAGGPAAVARQVDVALAVADLVDGVRRVPFAVPGGVDARPLAGRSSAARLVVRRWPLSGVLEVGAHPLDGPHGGLRLRVAVHNDVVWRDYDGPREAVLRRSLLGAHVLMAVTAGRFASMMDPPEWARPATRDCVNVWSWPVLVGDPRRGDAMLSAPVVLADYPTAARRRAPATALAVRPG